MTGRGAPNNSEIIAELTRVKVLFQARTIAAVIGAPDFRRVSGLDTSLPAAFSHALHDPAHQQSDRLGAGNPFVHATPISPEGQPNHA